ncbi:MAG: hypothetical protein GC202_09575 [Alphaproteobacteria bacterium]|nr:hypothetical protein [Alphaproteobacteria bacterium]
MDTNRRFLIATGSIAAAALLLPGRARAMRLEELDVPRQRLLVEACETQKTHQAVMADLVRQIEDDGVPGDEARKRVAAMACPFCGCPFASLDLPVEGEAPKF